MIKRAYCRCNSGHYFIGECCPFNGWSSAASRELAEAVEQLTRLGKEISVAELRQIRVSPATLWRTLMIEFATAACASKALSPGQYVVDGETKTPLKLGPSFK